jgi:hypothetical protein
MSLNWMWLLIVLGCLTSLLLLFFIRQQWLIIKGFRQKEDESKAKQIAQKKEIIQSIQVLAQAMIENQMELSEGCIRIRVLLDYIHPQLIEQAPFDIFDIMYRGTEHMPTHDERQKTDKHFVNKMDIQRYKLEREHQNQILAASKALRAFDFSKIESSDT